MEAADSFGMSVHIRLHGITYRKAVIIIVTAVRAFNLTSSGSQRSDEATDRTTMESGFDFWRGYEASPEHLDWLWGPLSLQYSGYLEFLSGVRAAGARRPLISI